MSKIITWHFKSGAVLSPWLCVAGTCALVCPASASQRVWGWTLWAVGWTAAPAPSSASLPAWAPSLAAPTDVPVTETMPYICMWQHWFSSLTHTVALCGQLTQSLCLSASSSAVDRSSRASSVVIFFSICAPNSNKHFWWFLFPITDRYFENTVQILRGYCQ